MTWYKIADNIQTLSFQENNMCVIAVADKLISLALMNNQLFAFAHKCPHASGILSEGVLDKVGNVICPVHGYKFCIKNGRNISGEGYQLKTYPLEHRETGIFIGL
jgi:nitrite reductase/ring-hydroxylating ferredoxin subunit